jgi:hypothetical protein
MLSCCLPPRVASKAGAIAAPVRFGLDIEEILNDRGEALYFVSRKKRKREYFSPGERAFFSSPLASAKTGFEAGSDDL